MEWQKRIDQLIFFIFLILYLCYNTYIKKIVRYNNELQLLYGYWLIIRFQIYNKIKTFFFFNFIIIIINYMN